MRYVSAAVGWSRENKKFLAPDTVLAKDREQIVMVSWDTRTFPLSQERMRGKQHVFRASVLSFPLSSVSPCLLCIITLTVSSGSGTCAWHPDLHIERSLRWLPGTTAGRTKTLSSNNVAKTKERHPPDWVSSSLYNECFRSSFRGKDRGRKQKTDVEKNKA